MCVSNFDLMFAHMAEYLQLIRFYPPPPPPQKKYIIIIIIIK